MQTSVTHAGWEAQQRQAAACLGAGGDATVSVPLAAARGGVYGTSWLRGLTLPHVLWGFRQWTATVKPLMRAENKIAR